MNTLKCVAIDDEPLALELIKSYTEQVDGLQLVQVFEDAIAGAEFLRRNKIDILFVDINMPDISGIDLVRSLEEKPVVIFTTAYKNFAYEGYTLEALDYLLKPIDITRFAKAMQKAKDYLAYKNAPKETESLFVYSEYRMVKISLDDIEYIESMEDYIKIHTGSAKPVLTLMPLKKVLEKLPAARFRRIHRSFVVAVARIQSISNRKVLLRSGIALPVSDSYQDFIKEWKGQM